MRYPIRIFAFALLLCTLAMIPGVIAKQRITEGTDPSVIDRWIETYNSADISRADEIFASDFVPHMPAILAITDRATYLWKIANPGVLNINVTRDDLFGTRDNLVGRFTVTADWPNGRHYTNTFIVFFRFENGLIAEEWWETDSLGVLEQIGVLPRSHSTYSWTAPSQVTGDPGVPGQNASLAVRAMQSINAQNFVLLEQVYSTEFLWHAVTVPFAYDRGSLELFMRNVFAAFPDQHVTIEDIVASSDRVAVRCSITGTQEGPFGAIPATGRRVRYSSMVIFRIADGHIVEQWESEDALALIQQLTVQ